MIYTNKLNLPKVFEKLQERKDPIPHRYGITELLGSTREIKLKRKYFDKLEEDISEHIPALFGSAVHKVFEENSNPEESEIKMEVEFGEDVVVGIIDHVDGDIIEDYKTCSVSKYTKQDFDDYKMQVYAYAYMRMIKFGIISRKGKIYMLMKDWSKIKAYKSSNYPTSPIYVLEFPIYDSDYDFIFNYINNKLKELNNNELPLCSDEDRWYTGTTYAVYKNVGDKKAALVAETEQEAHDYITNKCDGKGEIQVRKGEYLKCKYYCLCSKFCDQCKED